jgi:transcriptional regulator with XRE-family HTH domain
MDIAERLSEARGKSGLSARDLSLKAGLTQSVVGQIERRDVANPSATTLGSIARVLGVSVDWLLFGDEVGAPGDVETKSGGLPDAAA